MKVYIEKINTSLIHMQYLFAFHVFVHLQSSIYLLNMKMAQQSSHDEEVLLQENMQDVANIKEVNFRSDFNALLKRKPYGLLHLQWNVFLTTTVWHSVKRLCFFATYI